MLADLDKDAVLDSNAQFVPEVHRCRGARYHQIFASLGSFVTVAKQRVGDRSCNQSSGEKKTRGTDRGECEFFLTLLLNFALV